MNEIPQTKKIKSVQKYAWFVILFSLFLSILVQSCSTEKNALLNKAFHYTTTKFNGFYHGKEALKLAKKNLYNNHIDNFEEVLNIYRYGDKEQAKAEFALLDRAVSKASKMIDKHSMKFKVKSVQVESNKMIDDCYFLLGQAKFFKMQYDSTIQTYKFILNNYKKGKLYYPVHFELIKTYIQKENFVDAETKIKFLDEDKDFPKKHKGTFAVVKAHYYLKTNNPKEAIKFLEIAIPLVKSGKQKSRLSFILAQLYNKQNNSQRASELYAYVAKKSLNYEMAFNAKLNLALTLNSKDKSGIIGTLNKMLKDKKNKDYQDQIYFVLAQVHEKNGDMENAVVNYKKSAAASTTNPKQKALAYLAIADYYFKIPNYISAQAFYDSSLVSLPETHANYSKIVVKAKSLTDLVTQINIVQLEDSLQKLAALPEDERQKVIDKTIKNLEQKEEMQAFAEKAKLEQIKAAAATQANVGGWIFDNPNLLASANAEFIKIFGNRKLEDNWRRSNKASVIVSDFADGSSKNLDEYGNEKIAENKTSDYYLKGLPFTSEAVDSSNEKIKKALYETAVIFKDKLGDVQKANEYFEELNRRFPKSENRAIALYQLYRNYETSNNPEKAAINKDLILSEFPNSEYAELIKNPNKGAEEEILKAELNEYYEKILEKYNNGNYNQTIVDIDAIDNQFKKNPLKSNFDLLKAFAIGKLKGKEAFEMELKQIFINYPGTEVGNDVQAILDQIQSERMAQAGKSKQSDENQKTFESNQNETHNLIVIFASDIVNEEELMQKTSLYCASNFASDSLKLSIEPWSENEKMVIISDFSGAKTAQQFHKQIKLDLLDKIPNIGALNFVISLGNYSKLYRFKEIEKYLNFYKEEYK